MHSQIVYAGERWPSHQIDDFKKIYDSLPCQTPYRYINSGTVIGYAQALKNMLKTIKQYDTGLPEVCRCFADLPCDQTFVSKYFVENPGSIKLDYDCELFWCCSGEWEIMEKISAWQDGKFLNTITQKSPALIHVPWSSQFGGVYLSLAGRLI